MSVTKMTVVRPGMLTTIQDWPGRIGYWKVGVPPSGPMDDLSFRLGNVALGNPEGAPGLESAMSGPAPEPTLGSASTAGMCRSGGRSWCLRALCWTSGRHMAPDYVCT
jgi:allophanate hydrolase subunit 2